MTLYPRLPRVPRLNPIWTKLRRPSGVRCAQLGQSDAGAAAVEMAMVMPVLILLLFGIIQFGWLFYLQNTMVSVANDVTRRLAVGAITQSEAKVLAKERLARWPAEFSVAVAEPGGSDVSVAISVPFNDAAVIDVGGFFKEGTLAAHSVMRKE